MKLIQATPTISTSIYAANDAITAVEHISVGRSGFIERIVIKDKDNEGPQLTIHFFKGALANGAAANAAFALDDTDLLKWIGSVDFSTFNNLNGVTSSKVAVANDIRIPFDVEQSAALDYKLYYQLTTTGTPTYTNNNDLVIDFTILNDGDL